MSDNTGYPNSGDTTRTKLENSYNELKELLKYSYDRFSPAWVMENLINWVDNAESSVSRTRAAIESVENHRRGFLSIMEPTMAVVLIEYPAEGIRIRELLAEYEKACTYTVQFLERVSAIYEGRDHLSVPGVDYNTLRSAADSPSRDAYNSYRQAVEALSYIASIIKGLTETAKPALKGDEDADEPKGDGDANEPEGDADEPEGDEDADEPEGDEDADEPEGDADEPEGDEDADEPEGDEDAKRHVFSEDFNRKKNNLKYTCQGQRHDGEREPGGRGPEQSPGRRPDKPGQGKRQNRKKGSNQNKKGSKQNTYYLDPVTNIVYRCYPDTKIPANARRIRQLPDTHMPSPAAFYDFSLLPKGSSLSAPPDPAYVKDDDLRKRVGETAKRLGLGEDARRTLFQILDCTANRNTAFAEYIKVANDLDVAVPGSHDAALKAAVAAGNTYTSMLSNLPGSISARTNIIEALAELKRLFSHDARLVELYDGRSGSIMTIKCGSYITKETVCNELCDNDRLRVPLGAKILDRKNRGVETRNGKKHKYWTVTVACSKAPAIEIAAALSGESAMISHQLVEGKVSYQYKASVNGKVIETPLIPSPPTAASARFLFEQLLAESEPGLDAMVKTFEIVCQDPLSDLAVIAAKKFEASGKTICTLEDARQAFSLVVPSDVVSDEKRQSIQEAPRTVVTSTGKHMKVTYRHDAAYIDGFSFHPADPLVAGLVDEVPVGDEQFPTRIRHVKFVKDKKRQVLRAVIEDKDISEIRARRENHFASRVQDPEEALKEELRQHFISEVTRDMASMILNPEKFQIRNAEDPEGVMKRAVRRRHVDPYRSKNGDIIRLVATLTLSSPPPPNDPTWNASWHKWCQDSVKKFNANKNKTPDRDFFANAGCTVEDRENLIAAGMFLVRERLGRDVSREELHRIARSCGLEGDGRDDMFRGVDQGRALAHALAKESGKILPQPARKQKRPEPGNQAEVRGKSEVPRSENSVEKDKLATPGETQKKPEVVEAAREADLTAALTNSGSGEGQTKEKASENVRQMTPDESAAHEAGHDDARESMTSIKTPETALAERLNDSNPGKWGGKTGFINAAALRRLAASGLTPEFVEGVATITERLFDREVVYHVTVDEWTEISSHAKIWSASDVYAHQTKEKVSENVRQMTPDESTAHEAGHDDARETPAQANIDKEVATPSGTEISMNLSTNPEVIAKLANDEDEDVREAVAKNPSTPTEVLAKLANDEDEDVREAVAKNPSTPKDVLAKLANDESWSVRMYVASNPSTPAEVFAKLANDERWLVRTDVAKNPSTPKDVLAKLANDESWFVRSDVAENHSTPKEFLAKLANDESGSVRRSLAKNPSTPQEVLAKLANDEDESALKEAAKETTTPVSWSAPDSATGQQTEIGPDGVPHPPTPASEPAANLSRPTVEGSRNHAYAEKALLLKLDDRTKSALQAIPIPVLTERYATPVEIKRLHPKDLHVTLISYANFVNEKDDRNIIANHSFPAPSIELGECRYVHRTDAYDKDGKKILKVTYVVSLKNQGEMQEFVNKLYAQAGRSNPEPNRFFHVTLANNWEGDPFKSIGDVTIRDFQQS